MRGGTKPAGADCRSTARHQVREEQPSRAPPGNDHHDLAEARLRSRAASAATRGSTGPSQPRKTRAGSVIGGSRIGRGRTPRWYRESIVRPLQSRCLLLDSHSHEDPAHGRHRLHRPAISRRSPSRAATRSSRSAASRRPGGFDWSPASLEAGVAAADAIVHLAGENLFGKRWTEAQKKVLIESRVETTGRLARLAAQRRPVASPERVGDRLLRSVGAPGARRERAARQRLPRAASCSAGRRRRLPPSAAGVRTVHAAHSASFSVRRPAP